jgi:phospholipase/lecithinase/hemolysin
VFVLEANSVEIDPEGGKGLSTKHSVMRQIGTEENIRIIDIHHYLASLTPQSGNLWWDIVHPTTFGHKLIGQYIFENIKDLL